MSKNCRIAAFVDASDSVNDVEKIKKKSNKSYASSTTISTARTRFKPRRRRASRADLKIFRRAFGIQDAALE